MKYVLKCKALNCYYHLPDYGPGHSLVMTLKQATVFADYTEVREKAMAMTMQHLPYLFEIVELEKEETK